MNPKATKALRAFVAVTLLVGGLALLAGAQILQALPDAAGLAVLASAWTAALVAVVVLAARRDWTWPVPAAALLVSLLVTVMWAQFSPAGHLVLSGLTPAVTLMAAAGVLLRHRWAWPVAFALVVGFGPLFLAFAPLPSSVVLGAYGLFLATLLALLALHDASFETAGAA
jgi:hypothetical protein